MCTRGRMSPGGGIPPRNGAGNGTTGKPPTNGEAEEGNQENGTWVEYWALENDPAPAAAPVPARIQSGQGDGRPVSVPFNQGSTPTMGYPTPLTHPCYQPNPLRPQYHPIHDPQHPVHTGRGWIPGIPTTSPWYPTMRPSYGWVPPPPPSQQQAVGHHRHQSSYGPPMPMAIPGYTMGHQNSY